jgi:hypothetical protein
LNHATPEFTSWYLTINRLFTVLPLASLGSRTMPHTCYNSVLTQYINHWKVNKLYGKLRGIRALCTFLFWRFQVCLEICISNQNKVSGIFIHVPYSICPCKFISSNIH